MGYCITQTGANFTIKEQNFKPAYRAIKHQMSGVVYRWSNGTDWFNGLRDLYAVLEFWRYEPTLDEESGDMIGINFTGEKIGDENLLFQVIAPFVEKGSFIEMVGEDGAQWRWVFDGKTCKEVIPKISWE